jgi:NADH-quinone oxidoreductase subunit D
MEPIERDLDSIELELSTEPLLLNVGPAHSATQGAARIVVELSGETIERCDVQIGYLHRGVEKMCERATYTQVIPYVERCNYASSMLNNIGFVLACEKLLRLEVPERCQYYRMILGELSRITDHLTCLSGMAMELGASTPALWMIKGRDLVAEVLEAETGARLTHSFGRIGGMAHPPTSSLGDHVEAVFAHLNRVLDEVERTLVSNRIFIGRLADIGTISADDAISLGFTGPTLRATGVPYDVRRSHPYLKYGEMEFDVPVGANGDCLDRFCVRLEEMRQSIHIVQQCLKSLPSDGPVSVDNPAITLPQRELGHETDDDKMRHRSLVFDGIKLPPGEVYGYTEAGNGELGFYLVSDGSGTPYRLRIRPPCFYVASGLERVLLGHTLADIPSCFGSLNVVGGECDR